MTPIFVDEETMSSDCYLGAVDLFDLYVKKNPGGSYLDNKLASSCCALLSIKHEYDRMERYIVRKPFIFHIFNPVRLKYAFI